MNAKISDFWSLLHLFLFQNTVNQNSLEECLILDVLVKGEKFTVLLQVVFSLMILLLQESLKKVLQEKLEAIQRLTEIEVC